MTRDVESEPKNENIRSAERTLQILRAMNQRPVSSIDYLHTETGLPKPTLVRFLKTMVNAGYVTNDRLQAGYQLTSLVTSLSSGYHGDPLVVEAGRAWALNLTRQLKWPVSIAVLEQNAMVVRLSTVAESQISPFHATINMRLGLFSRGLGRAYLAFCSDEQIAAFAQIVAANDPEEAPYVPDPESLRKLISSIRESGFARRNFRVEPKSSDTLAVPIFLDGEVRATIGITYFASVVREKNVILEYAGLLQKASAQITMETDRLKAHNDAEHWPSYPGTERDF